MLRKTFSRFRKQKNIEVNPAASPSAESASPPGEVAKMLSSSGRIGLAILQKIAQEKDKESFIRFMRQPVLAGAAIQACRFRNR